MMSEIDRQKVFWLLKKYSSYTAWKALGDVYEAFADAWILAMKKSDMRDSTEISWRSGHTREILDGKIAFQRGLPLLKQGNRQVFRHNSRGHLNKSADAVIFAHRIMNPDEFVFDWMNNKNDVVAKEKTVNAATSGLLMICEGDDELGLSMGTLRTYKPHLGPYNFPQTLPSIPLLTNHIFQTGDEILFDGIYEPEWSVTDLSGSNWLDKLKSATSDSGNPQIDKGCMNYLISGAKAPLYQDGEFDKPMPVVWRLIWKDERYLDGTIPEEEVEYLKPIEELAPQQLRCEANEPCKKTGYWWTVAKQNSRRHFKKGEVMPDFPNSSYGKTIWMWDQDQAGSN